MQTNAPNIAPIRFMPSGQQAAAAPGKPQCASCHLRELCLPAGLRDEDVARLDALLFARRRVKLGESLFRERGVRAILRAHVQKVEPGLLHYEQLDGSEHSLAFDFAMLLPPFRGADLKAYDRAGAEITDRLFAPNGLTKVDADYTPKPYDQWSADDWPKTYRNPSYPDVFAPGIAFAPPHQISVPHTSPSGTVITPAPPRTGMPSGIMAKAVALTIKDLIERGEQAQPHKASMAAMGAACVASAGTGLTRGSAASMTMFPVVPDWKRYPGTGRDVRGTSGELGLAGHWIKAMLHYLFLYKAKARPLWFLIPE